jgi:hypothetical protein
MDKNMRRKTQGGEEEGWGSYCYSNAFPLRRRVRIQLVHHIDCSRVVRG